MKLRGGFVSNSSTASFLVKHIDMLDKVKGREPRLTPAQENKLQKMGFFKTFSFYPNDVKEATDEEKAALHNYHYGYTVICNEKEVLDWLVKNNIGFEAHCHYGQYTVVHRKEWDYVLSLKNMGTLYLMHCLDKLTEKAVKKIPKSEFLKLGGGYFF